MKCAVVDCVVPIYSIGVWGGLMVLGEVGGVRVFPLRPLVKGKNEEKVEVRRKRVNGKGHVGSSRSLVKGEVVKDVQKKRLPNGVIMGSVGVSEGHGRGCSANCMLPKFREEASEVEWVVNNSSEGRGLVNKEQIPIKHRTLKLKQNAGDHGSFFVEFVQSEIRRPEAKSGPVPLLKAVAIHALSQRKFLVVDSFGDLHFLSMQNAITSEMGILITKIGATIQHVDCSLKVQMLAVLPDLSSESQIAWMSDGSHSLHVASLTGMEISVDENVDKEKETPVQISESVSCYFRFGSSLFAISFSSPYLLRQDLLNVKICVVPAFEVMNYFFLALVTIQVHDFQQNRCMLKDNSFKLPAKNFKWTGPIKFQRNVPHIAQHACWRLRCYHL